MLDVGSGLTSSCGLEFSPSLNPNEMELNGVELQLRMSYRILANCCAVSAHPTESQSHDQLYFSSLPRIGIELSRKFSRTRNFTFPFIELGPRPPQ
jgi:hypothetical protein